MGLDLILRNPNDSDDCKLFFGNEHGSEIRVVNDMEHYCLVATSGKSLRELKNDILMHISKMMLQIDTYAYVPTQSRHDMRVCYDQEITLQSDLEIMARLVGELVATRVPDHWIVEWSY